MLEIRSTDSSFTQQFSHNLPKNSPSVEGPFTNNKVVIITGASQGIGESTAFLLAERGWSVWATTRNLMKCELKHKKIHLLEVKLDSEESIKSAVQYVLEKEGHVDALINNAGQMLIGACEETPAEIIKNLFEVNVMAPIRLAQAILPSMRMQNYGRIINLSSGAAIQALPGLGAFSASKAALYAFFQAMAAEILFWNIKITSLEVGTVQTPWIANCLIPVEGNVEQYNCMTQSLTARLKMKNQIADGPAVVAGEIASLLECEAPPLRKPASATMSNFMEKQLVDLSGERYIQEQRNFLQSIEFQKMC